MTTSSLYSVEFAENPETKKKEGRVTLNKTKQKQTNKSTNTNEIKPKRNGKCHHLK